MKTNWFKWIQGPVIIVCGSILITNGFEWWEAMLLTIIPSIVGYCDGCIDGER